MMKNALIVAALLSSAGICHAQMPPFEGSDNFAGTAKDPMKWGDNIFNGPALLTPTGGVLKFSNPIASSGDEDHFMAWPWQAYGPIETSWSVQADVNVPVITLPDDHAAVGMGVVVRNASDGTDLFTMQVENVRSQGQPQQYNFFNSLDINDSTTEVSTPAPTGKVLSVRIVWNADTLTLSAQYDADGPTNGYSWQTLNAFSPVFGGWELTPFDNFEVAIVGSAEKIAVAASKNVYLDNFLIAPVAPANLAGSDNFNDNARDPAKWGIDAGDGGSTLTESNGRLEFTKTETADNWAGRPWVANTGSYTEDWEAFADLHLGNVAVPVDGDDLRLYISAEAGGFTASVMLEISNESGTPTRQFRFEEEGPGGGTASAATASTDGSVRVAFDATEKVLSFYYDANGAADGFTWTLLGSVDVDDPGSDWGLIDLARFHIALFGESEGVLVASGDAHFDNFNTASAYEPLITGSPNGFEQFTTAGRNLQKWGQIVENGTAALIQNGDGVLRFTGAASAPDDDSMEAWIWQANGSYAASWSAQADVHVPIIPLAPGNTAAGMGIAVLNSADNEDNFTATLENYRSTGQPQQFHFLSTLDINGQSEPETFAPASSALSSIRVAWNHTTKQLTAAYDADGPLNGYSWTIFKTFSPAGAASWNMTASNSFKVAIYGSSEETAVTENHGFWADNFYIFGTTTTLLPVVKTEAVANIVFDGATVRGNVNAKGTPRAVFFDWGLTTSYGSSISATPDVVSDTTNAAVTGQLTGLMPHTKYNYRVRATSALGTASGANMTFTTDNRDPAAVADAFSVLPGAIATLNVLGNDTDPDLDPLSIKSSTALVPTNAGKLTKSGNNFVFTAAANFAGPATFTYAAKDAFGGSSSIVTVTLTLGSCSLSHSEAFPLPSARVTYDVDVTANGSWSAVENLSWVSVTPLSGTDDGTVSITLQPNAALAARTGTVTIGGQAHVITQAGVLVPDISLAVDPPPPAVVGGWYELDIVTVNPPVTYTVAGLPAGLTFNATIGRISGRPTKATLYPHVKITAKNAAGPAPTILDFPIDVAALNPSFVGTFHGLITPEPILNEGFGSRLELTITGTGGVTGKMVTAATSVSFKGNLEPDANDPNAATFMVLIGTGANQVVLDVAFDPLTDSLAGTLSDSLVSVTPVAAWRNPWKTGHKATSYAALHTLSLEPPPPDPMMPFPTPEGFGFATFKPNDGTGAVTVSGKLPDNTTFTTTTFIGEYGQVLVYAPLYGNKGCVSGILTVTPNDEGDLSDNDLSGTLDWFKFPSLPPSKETVYPFGIPPTQLTAEGGAYLGIPAGGLVLGLSDPPGNATLAFTGAQLAEETLDFNITFDIANPSPTGLTNKATFPADAGLNPNLVSMNTLNAATGAFSGEFTIPGATPAENRKVTFQGQIVKDPFMGAFIGRGHCLVPMPIFPPIITAANALKTSSRVELFPAGP